MKTKLTHLFSDFFESEKTSGIILIFCTITSIAIANSNLGTDYLALWHTKIAIGVGGTVHCSREIRFSHLGSSFS